MSVTAKDFDNDFPITWCPGCGNFPILTALKQALAELNIKPHEFALISGIGQAGKLPHYLKCNFFNGLHGRALPLAAAVRIANTSLPVIAVGGDGDMFGEGGNHFIHTMRRNINLTVLAHNNKVFGLTRGQASPTTDLGTVTKVQTHGVFLQPFNPLAVAVLHEAPFVARSYSGDVDHLARTIRAGIEAPGLSFIELLQPCVSFDKKHTFQYYKERVYDLADTDHDVADPEAAVAKSREWGDKIPIGLFYRNENRPTFEDESAPLQAGPLVDREFDAGLMAEVMDSFL